MRFHLRQFVIPVVLTMFLPKIAAGQQLSEASQQSELTDMLMTLPQRWKLSLATSEPSSAEPLPRPVLHWSNPIRKSPSGATFLWTHNGRPVAAMCSFPNLGNTDYEFQSLSVHPLLAETVDGEFTWQPGEPGVEIHDLVEVAPLESRLRRIVQMRRIANSFTADIVHGKGEGSQQTRLRLLTTPLYRYPADVSNDSESSDASDTPRGALIDGALFCFVQSTDPEILLMLEVWKDSDDKLTYTYSLGRMSVVIMQVTYDGKVVWKTRWGNKGPRSKYHTVKTTARWPGYDRADD